MVPSIAALVLSGALELRPLLASTVVVPDDISTVQLAIDSGADTVMIREGTYPERPVIDHAVVLQGVGASQHPRLAGLQIYNSNFRASPAQLRVSRVDFSGRVDYATLYVHPRALNLSFLACALDSGLQVVSQDSEDIFMLAIYNCRIAGASTGHIDQLFMVGDTVDGGVAWRARSPGITDCWFRGGPGRAIELTGNPVLGPIARNRIENYGTGIYAEYLDLYAIEDNTILRCGTGIRLSSVSGVTVARNEIRDCGFGVDVWSCDGLALRDNTIVGSASTGARLSSVWGYFGLVAEHNTVGRCGGSGIVIEGSEQVILRGNTVFDNGYSGVVLAATLGYPTTIENNIGAANDGWGLTIASGGVVDLGCNDWFGNGLGSVNGVSPGASDLSVDPLFCNADGADVRLDSASPLVNAQDCGQIGARGVGCGVTATLVQRFTAERASEGIRIVWQVGEGGTASEIWLERSEGTNRESWIQPLTQRSIESSAVVELDRSAVSDRAYRYRLVALEGNDVVVIGAPIVIDAQAALEFRLLQVGPNPGSGAVRIGFALAHAADIEVAVFDVQGRRIASPVRGPWPAGRHEVEWDGRTRSGAPAPAGIYLLRYVYPGGQDRRGIARFP
jgi:parallel beta-helix repeat protein